MSEKQTSAPVELTADLTRLADIVVVDSEGRGHRPPYNGKYDPNAPGGQYLSNYQMNQIESNYDKIIGDPPAPAEEPPIDPPDVDPGWLPPTTPPAGGPTWLPPSVSRTSAARRPRRPGAPETPVQYPHPRREIPADEIHVPTPPQVGPRIRTRRGPDIRTRRGPAAAVAAGDRLRAQKAQNDAVKKAKDARTAEGLNLKEEKDETFREMRPEDQDEYDVIMRVP